MAQAEGGVYVQISSIDRWDGISEMSETSSPARAQVLYKVWWYLRGVGKPSGSRHNSPDELKRGSFHLLPNYGTILPSTGATFCHCRAQNNASGEKFREVYHRHSEYAFRLLEAWFCSWKTLLSFLLFTLHGLAWNPDKHWGCERWRVVVHSSQLFTTLHTYSNLSWSWYIICA